MKCIKCQNDSKYSERSSGTCPKCNAKFAFEPKSGDLFTDAAFAAAIDRVSAHDAVRFTEANLYYELARLRRRSDTGVAAYIVLSVIAFLVTGVISLATSVIYPFLGGLAIAVTLLSIAALSKKRATPSFTPAMFQTAFQKWRHAHGTPGKFVNHVHHALSRKERKELPRELATYSFDRAVICDRPETVDLLLANNFHFENNCAILAVTHYPPAVFSSVLDMLRRNPRIEVYALHDASITGHTLAHRLATDPEWFRGIGRVTDVGLLVRHAEPMRGLWKETGSNVPVNFRDLTPAQNAWLAQYTLELAAIKPEQIVKRLFRAMTQPGTQVTTDGGDVFFVGGSSFGSDASTSDGGGDSFG